MSAKIVRAIVIGVIAGLFVGFGVAWLMKANGTPDRSLALYCGIVGGLITTYLLGNLSGNRAIASAGAAEERQALERTPPAGKALLYVYREGFVAKLAGLNISIDGHAVAQLKAPRFTCIAIPPGTHTLSAQFGGLAGAQSKTGEFAFSAEPDGVAVVKINISMGALQGSVRFAPQPDVAATKLLLAGYAMTPPDVAEI